MPRRPVAVALLLGASTVCVLGAPRVWAALPGDLAPSAPELQESEQRLQNLLATNRAVASATSRLQATWALPPVTPEEAAARADASAKAAKPGADLSRTVRPQTAVASPTGSPCANADRLALGWRIERFGTAWRDTAQAVRVAAVRLQTTRQAPTAYPLVDERWATRLDALAEEARLAERAWREASVWQARFVRPVIQACPAPDLGPAPGVAAAPAWALGERPPAVAVLARGDGVVCPDGERAEDAIVVLHGTTACWSVSTPCACDPQPVEPGAVVAEPR